MTATTARPRASQFDARAVARALNAAMGQMATVPDHAGKLTFLTARAAELAAAHARLTAPPAAPRPAPTNAVPADAPAGTRVELTVSGYYPLAGAADEYRFIAGERLTLCRPMSVGDGDAMLVVSEDGRAARIPHGNLQLAGAV